jgi:hypothetical protein
MVRIFLKFCSRRVDLMPDIVGSQMTKLTKKSAHYRQLATKLVPDEISGEIAAVADELDFEIAIFVATSETLAHALIEEREGGGKDPAGH